MYAAYVTETQNLVGAVGLLAIVAVFVWEGRMWRRRQSGSYPGKGGGKRRRRR